jgi:hypothetical protein
MDEEPPDELFDDRHGLASYILFSEENARQPLRERARPFSRRTADLPVVGGRDATATELPYPLVGA